MRKVIFSILTIGLMLGGIFQQVQAQERKLDFNLNIGGLTDEYFDSFILASGAGLDFHLGKRIMISPEVLFWSYRFEAFFLNPGVILNFKLNNFFFFGGGVLIAINLSGYGDLESGDLMSKINAGLRVNNVKLTLHLISIFEEDYLFGANIGIVF